MLLALGACSDPRPASTVDASMTVVDGGADAGELPFGACPPSPRGCELPPGDYLPVMMGPMQRVLVPANTRYLNDHTLVRDDGGRWHVFGITSTSGPGGAGFAGQRQFLHATAESLAGPWTEQPDVIVLRPEEPSRTSAPYIVRDQGLWQMFWYHNVPNGGRVAHAPDLFDWTRDPQVIPGGRDPFVMRLDDGRWALYTTSLTTEADGLHDSVAVFISRSLTDWSEASEGVALRNPEACHGNDCWGWYESPTIAEVGGAFYLFVTFTSSSPGDYERTWVFRSHDPTRFEPTPITELRAHAGELVRDRGRMFLTSGGWPSIVGEARRGLSMAAIAWVRMPR